MVLGRPRPQRRDIKGTRSGSRSTAAMGLTFLGFQAYEFNHFIARRPAAEDRISSAAASYVMTGFHGVHVLVGVIWLIGLAYTPGVRWIPGAVPSISRSQAFTGTSSISCGSSSLPSSTSWESGG